MGERHTRGGLNANSEWDATWQARAERGRMQGGAKQKLSTIGTDWCWCGGKLCSAVGSWLGHDRGLPHPRDREDLAVRLERAIEEGWQ